MTSRERIITALNHQIPDRVPVHDAPWNATVHRWHKEGLPDNISPAEYFGYEMKFFGADLSPRFPTKVVERTDRYIIETTSTGGKRKNFIDYSTTPEIIDWPIKTKADWKEIKKRLNPDFTRIDWATTLRENARAREEGKFTCFGGACGYDALQGYMKSEQLLISMAEDPGWVKEMIMTLAHLIVVTADMMIKNGCRFDAVFLYNDMGYKNGLLFSPKTYLQTHYEADKILFDYFHSKGMKTILHSCGNVKELIPILIETGLDCLQPLEVKAGMDIIELKQLYGDKLCFMGGIDARLMADPDPSKIEEEIQKKFQAAKVNGGYIYHSDHSIPKNVSFEQYCRVIELVQKYGIYENYQTHAAAPEIQAGIVSTAKPVPPVQTPAAVSGTQTQTPPVPKTRKRLFKFPSIKGIRKKPVPKKPQVLAKIEITSAPTAKKISKLPFEKLKNKKIAISIAAIIIIIASWTLMLTRAKKEAPAPAPSRKQLTEIIGIRLGEKLSGYLPGGTGPVIVFVLEGQESSGTGLEQGLSDKKIQVKTIVIPVFDQKSTENYEETLIAFYNKQYKENSSASGVVFLTPFPTHPEKLNMFNTNNPPKIGLQTRMSREISRLIKNGRIQVVITSVPGVRTREKGEKISPEEAFNQKFIVITPDNFEEVIKQHSQFSYE